MQKIRQLKRFNPKEGDPYFDLNISLSSELNKIKNNFIDKKILDIGSGEVPFSEFYEGLNVHTCDIQQNSQNTIDFIIKVDEVLPFKNECYDVIFIFDVLEHIRDDVSFILDCKRILRKDGIIVSNTPFMYRFHEEPYDYRRYTPSGLKYIFEDVGKFKIKKLIPLGSVFFSASTLILERDFKLSLLRKVVYKIILFILNKLKSFDEVSSRSPFSYFVYAKKN